MAKIINILGGGDSNNSFLRVPLMVPSTGSKEREISLQEVSWHDTAKDCWIIIYDRVYDVSDFMDEHPGGEEVLLENAGRDASLAFRGTGHSALAIRALDKFLIGELPMTERIFRKPDGLRLSDIPT